MPSWTEKWRVYNLVLSSYAQEEDDQIRLWQETPNSACRVLWTDENMINLYHNEGQLISHHLSYIVEAVLCRWSLVDWWCDQFIISAQILSNAKNRRINCKKNKLQKQPKFPKGKKWDNSTMVSWILTWCQSPIKADLRYQIQNWNQTDQQKSSNWRLLRWRCSRSSQGRKYNI